MNKKRIDRLFIIWNPFQRRSQSLGRMLDVEIKYYHYLWEENGILFKALSYLFKSIRTITDLLHYRPSVVFLQLAPTPILYIASVYCFLTKAIYISDCHNTMIYDSHWIKWPFAKLLLSRSFLLIVHNSDVSIKAKELNLDPLVLRDPLPALEVTEEGDRKDSIIEPEKEYVIVPCGMAVDEPVEELFKAACEIQEIDFFLTWYAEKLPTRIRGKAPENVRFTGFLDEPDFNRLYANASVALVLTTREGTQPSGASEAIALGVPLVVSDIHTTRRLYGNSVVLVQNKSRSIVNGLRYSLKYSKEMAKKIESLKTEMINETDEKIRSIRRMLQMCC